MKYLAVLFLLSLTQCARIQVSDHEYCGDMGSLGATCFHFLTAATRDIPQPDWDNMRFGQICTNDPNGQQGATFADIKATIEKLCSESKDCVYPPTSTLQLQKKHMEDFFRRVESFQAVQRASRR